MKPTKYEPKRLLNTMEVGQSVSLELKHRPSITSAITRLHKGEKRFTTQKMDQAVFKIERIL